ncbi:MAG: [FeFe] hydrogenase H-cluster maturation GTPase HydF, partial [Bacillota bacterium]
MQDTPKGNRLHIAIFGLRNAGKSSLINALTNQDIALVSNVPGTTTDPVYKAMEILPIGPVMLIDTAGIDDEGALGELRVERTKQVMNKADVAIVVIAADTRPGDFEHKLIAELKAKQIPLVGVINKMDIATPDNERKSKFAQQLGISFLEVSSLTREGIEELKHTIIRVAPDTWEGPSIVGDLLDSGDLAVLVIPIDLAAPKGRLILPQVQTLRDILDHDAYALVVKERELRDALDNLPKRPKLVITDSQAFLKVNADTPPDIK